MMTVKTLNDKPLLSELLAGAVVVDAADDREIHGITLDSRAVQKGYLFLACAGTREHGLVYADQAVRQGAVAIVWETDGKHVPDELFQSRHPGLVMIGMNSLSQRAGIIASHYYGAPSRDMNVVGITGTNGKTSCSHFLAQALNRDVPCAVIGTLGNGMYGALESASHTTPDAVTLHAMFDNFRSQGAQCIVMEVSSHGLDQGRVNGVEFDIAIFTNLSRDHLDYHDSMEEYAEAKRRLFEVPTLQQIIINADDEYGRQLMKSAATDLQLISYGFGEGTTDDLTLKASQLTMNLDGIRFYVETPWGKGLIDSPLMGRYNASNLLAVLAALLALGIGFEEAVSRIQDCRTVAGRMERIDGTRNQPLVIVDYAHTPDALENSLTALRDHLPAGDDSTVGKCSLWCIFGCGGDRDRGKRAEMGAIAERLADDVVITNDNPRTEDAQTIVADILQGMKNPGHTSVIFDRRKAIETIVRQAAPDDIIFVAGKGHEQYQIVGETKLPYEGDAELVKAIFAQDNRQAKY